MDDKKALRSVLRDVGYWACILALLVVAGCGPVKKVTNWLTGADKPAVEGEDADGDGVPDASPAARLISAVKNSGLPFSEGATGILSFLAGRYVLRSRVEAAKKKGAA